MAARTYKRKGDQEPAEASGFDGRRIVAIMAQFASWYTTWLFVLVLGGDGVIGLGVSVGVEWLLVEGKRLLATHRFDRLGLLCLGIDTIFNAGGIWAPIQNMDKTESWKMLVGALNLTPELRQVPALVIALAVGALLSVAPHRLWTR
jgi:hypothetical protein